MRVGGLVEFPLQRSTDAVKDSCDLVSLGKKHRLEFVGSVNHYSRSALYRTKNKRG